MHLALSPYHLTTREPALMAGLLLATRATTILPVPSRGLTRPDVRRALHESPSYLRLIESWRWCGPMWRCGLIQSLLGDDDAMRDARDADKAMTLDDSWAALAHFHRDDLFGADRQFLDTVSTDMLKGGPDPGISVPIVAGLDRLAMRHGLTAVRSGGAAAPSTRVGPPPSLAQRAEAMMGESVCSAALPILTSVSGGTLLKVREMLEPELHPLREALALTRSEADTQTIQARVRAAAKRYGEAFEPIRRELVGQDDDLGKRITSGTVRVDARRLPADAALRATLVAFNTARSAGRGARTGRAAPVVSTNEPSTPKSPPLHALVITPMDVG